MYATFQLVDPLYLPIIHLSAGFKFFFYVSVADIPVNTLGDDFVKLVNDPTFSDVCFKVEGKKVHAHKAILVMRSKYFKAMFTTQMEEASKVGPFSARLHVYNSSLSTNLLTRRKSGGGSMETTPPTSGE